MYRLKELKMPAVALTDKYNLFGLIHFYQAAVLNGIKPILGCELCVENQLSPKFTDLGKDNSAYHLVLVAETEQGYKNLVQLSTAGYLNANRQTPRINKAILAKYAKGLIAFSGCLEGEIAQLILKDEVEKAYKIANEYRDIFGKNNFFIELQDHGLSQEKKASKELINLSRKSNIPMVATNDVHYLNKSDSLYHEVLWRIGEGKILEDDIQHICQSDEFYLKSSEEMFDLFSEITESIDNSVYIAERCNVTLDFGKTIVPLFVPHGAMEEENQQLEKLCFKKLNEKFHSSISESIKKRLQHELEIIKSTGFSGYFLIVHDFVYMAKQKGIPIGPGRGSAAGSFVAYLLNITEIDPLQYDLLFERFINPERVTAPDIDIDVGDRYRADAIHYFFKKYGQNNVASIITFGTMAARAVLRDVGRILKLPLSEIDHIVKLIPNEPKITLDESCQQVPELKSLSQDGGKYQKLFDISRALEGLVRHTSTHASGIVISKDPLGESIPLCLGSQEEILTQYDMGSLKELGFLKFDILGLRTLTTIDDCIQQIYKFHRIQLSPSSIPLDDKATFDLFQKAKTIGIFQFESNGIRDYLRKLEPENIEDIIALLALYRPGPLGSDMVDDFIHRKKGKSQITYLHPQLKPILEKTYGIILYQEQVMEIAKELGGFTFGQADLLRRAMGNKDPEKMEAMRSMFLEGSVRYGIDQAEADSIFDQMAKFAGYGYNKSHSAAYAILAYRTAFLKVNYFPEFMSALMTNESENHEKIAQYVIECKTMRVNVLKPDINMSTNVFQVDSKKQIIFSLLAIKTISAAAVQAILEARNSGESFQSFLDFCQRVDLKHVSMKMIENLIWAGVFDSLDKNRNHLVQALETIYYTEQKKQNDIQIGQTTLFGSSPIIADSEKNYASDLTLVQKLMKEKEILGFYFSDHPLSEYEWELKNCVTPLYQLPKSMSGSNIKAAGLIVEILDWKIKKTNEDYSRFYLEDLDSRIEIIVWPEIYKKFKSVIAKDELVAVQGKLDIVHEKIRIIASEIILVKEVVEKWAKSIRIKLNLIGIDALVWETIQSIFKKHPGNMSVFFELETLHHGIVVLKIGEKYRIHPTKSFLKNLSEFLNPEVIHIEF
jgi:DNA polymerase-3 subunit alpha